GRQHCARPRRRPLRARPDIARQRERDARPRGRLRRGIPRRTAAQEHLRERRRHQVGVDGTGRRVTSTSVPLAVAENTGLSLLARAELVGRESAGPAAADVDREGRFPHEAVDALRAHKLLNCAVPVDQGGEGASLGELCAVARILGRYCASTAMIFPMHQTQILSLVHHSTPGVAAFVAEAVANDYLIASATTELGTGGDVRSSVCAVARDGDTVTLTKNAPVISYGEYADAILVTARRTAD